MSKVTSGIVLFSLLMALSLGVAFGEDDAAVVEEATENATENTTINTTINTSINTTDNVTIETSEIETITTEE
ncbi:MAG: hypothetical protein H6R31_468 [Methanomicrobia archaeon]|nr:hypothetical protein [Methanomicrobia archaeon]